jgi:predicted ArsR family transcriptional regulator
MAVRQHLMDLEKKGIVTRSARNKGVGRPIYVYSLTDKAAGIFPHAYVKFSLDILRLIEKERGRDAVLDLLRARNAEICADLLSVCPRQCACDERLQRFIAHKNSEGSMAEVKRAGDRYVIDSYNCIISEVAVKYPEVCRYELDTMKTVFGRSTRLEHHMLDGFAACRFTTPV